MGEFMVASLSPLKPTKVEVRNINSGRAQGSKDPYVTWVSFDKLINCKMVAIRAGIRMCHTHLWEDTP